MQPLHTHSQADGASNCCSSNTAILESKTSLQPWGTGACEISYRPLLKSDQQHYGTEDTQSCISK